MAVDPNTISRFRWLLVWLADSLTSEDIQKARILLKNRIGPRYDDIGDDALKLFDVLERENLINGEDTNLLRVLLTHLDRNDLSEHLDEYQSERKVLIRRLNKNATLLEGPFFGYFNVIDDIVGILEDTFEHIHLVCISGKPGSGKSRMAREACLRARHHRKVIVVDLQELSTIESVFFTLMHAFDINTKDYEPDNLFGFLRNYDCREHGGAILFLDNVDRPLESGLAESPNLMYTEFEKYLENITNLPNPKLKILMTSRIGLEPTALNPQVIECFNLDGKNEMDLNSAIDMFRYHSGKTVLEDQEAEELVQLCVKQPLAMKVLASRLQDGNTAPKDLVKFMSPKKTQGLPTIGLAKEDQMTNCLQNSIKSLPSNHQRNFIKLAVIPGSFTVNTARKILEFRKRDIVSLKLDLQTLKYRSLLAIEKNEDTDQNSTKELRYKMHPLLRSCIERLVEDLSNENKVIQIYEDAKKSYLTHYGKRLRKLAKHLEADFVDALSELNEERAHYVRYVEMLKTVPQESPDVLRWVSLAVELIYFTQDRAKFYKTIANEAMKCNDMLNFATSTALEVKQLLDLGHDPELLLTKLEEVTSVINKEPEVQRNRNKLSLAYCYFVRGIILYRNQRTSESIPWLQQCVDIRKEYLSGKSGSHLLIARALNSLGFAIQTKAADLEPLTDHAKAERKRAIQRAIECYQEAYDMCRRLTRGSDKHVDIPIYVLNIGTCFHEIEKYEEAIEYYQKALQLERAMGMDETVNTCLILKNIAMSCCELGRTDDAIHMATRAMEGRKRLLGPLNHQTVRSVYFVGSVYLSASMNKEAQVFLDEALAMEEELWRRGIPHTSDWPRLKIRIETLMVTLNNRHSLTNYMRRFEEAEDEANKEKSKLEFNDNQDLCTSVSELIIADDISDVADNTSVDNYPDLLDDSRYAKYNTEDEVKPSESISVDNSLNEFGITLKIPRNAIKPIENISLAISQSSQRPSVPDDHYIIGPVISCKPDGIKFLQPVTISVPHSFVYLSSKYIQIWSKSESTESPHDWHMIYDGMTGVLPPDTAIQVVVERSKIKYRVDHFSLFYILLKPISIINKLVRDWMYPNTELVLDIWAYLSPVNVTDMVLLRIYALQVNDQAGKHQVRKTELGQDGGLCAVPMTFILSINEENLSVQVRNLIPRATWVTGDMIANIPFRYILLGGLGARCEFQFELEEDLDEHPNRFRGAFDLIQKGNQTDRKGIHFGDHIARKSLENQRRDIQRQPENLHTQDYREEIRNAEMHDLVVQQQQRDDPVLQQQQRDDPVLQHHQRDDPVLQHHQRDDPVLQQHQSLRRRTPGHFGTHQKDSYNDKRTALSHLHQTKHIDPLSSTGARPKQKSVSETNIWNVDKYDDQPMIKGDKTELWQHDPLLTGARPKQKTANPVFQSKSSQSQDFGLQHKTSPGQDSSLHKECAITQNVAILHEKRSICYRGDPKLPFGGSISGMYSFTPTPLENKDSGNIKQQGNPKQSLLTKSEYIGANQTKPSLPSKAAVVHSDPAASLEQMCLPRCESELHSTRYTEANTQLQEGNSAPSISRQGAVFPTRENELSVSSLEEVASTPRMSLHSACHSLTQSKAGASHVKQSEKQPQRRTTSKLICGNWEQVFRKIARKMAERGDDLPKYAEALNFTDKEFEEINRKHKAGAYFVAFDMLNTWLSMTDSNQQSATVMKMLIEAIGSVNRSLANDVMDIYTPL